MGTDAVKTGFRFFGSSNLKRWRFKNASNEQRKQYLHKFTVP